ncbi:MAG: RNA 3'-terminal phosphate cyclase [Phycisphaerae bacterium]
MTREPIHIDGSQGEGGGQILRTTVGLAAAFGLNVRIDNIRANRSKPGLRPQHLTAMKAAAEICDASLSGAVVGSKSLTFRPGRVRPRGYRFDIGTAGSTMLVLQTLLPALSIARGNSAVEIIGGTHNPMAPCFEYISEVFEPLASILNLHFHVQLNRPGFYPAGGGEIRADIMGLDYGFDIPLMPARFTRRGELKRVEVLSAVSGSLPDHIADRQAQQARSRLAAAGIDTDGRVERPDTLSPGTVVFVRAVYARSTAGFFSLGKRGKPAERVADEAIDAFLAFHESEGVIDQHAADQLLTVAGLSPEPSEFVVESITSHLRTNAAVINALTGRHIAIDDNANKVTIPRVPDDELDRYDYNS